MRIETLTVHSFNVLISYSELNRTSLADFETMQNLISEIIFELSDNITCIGDCPLTVSVQDEPEFDRFIIEVYSSFMYIHERSVFDLDLTNLHLEDKSPSVKTSNTESKTYTYFIYAKDIDTFVDCFKHNKLPKSFENVKLYKSNQKSTMYQALIKNSDGIPANLGDYFSIRSVYDRDIDALERTFWGCKEITTFKNIKKISDTLVTK